MPYLQAIGKTIVHMGPVGAGHMTKALNNLLLAANMVVASEALALAAKAGLAPEKVVAAINGSSGRSYITEYRFPNFVLKGDYSSRGGMAMSLLVKDVAIACDTAKTNHAHQRRAGLDGAQPIGRPRHRGLGRRQDPRQQRRLTGKATPAGVAFSLIRRSASSCSRHPTPAPATACLRPCHSPPIGRGARTGCLAPRRANAACRWE